jgi:uracil-DNA glycosylase
MILDIHSSWKPLFDEYSFDIDIIYKDLEVFPKNKEDIFKVFKIDVKDIKIVFLGQDCYHNNEKQANGLAFSVSKGVTIPPSLKNIFKELLNEFPERNYNFNNGDLSLWLNNEKIFLLNCSLTVEKSKPGSHMEIWKEFTDDVIKFINKNNKNCVYILLGKYAENKKLLIDKNEHRNIIISAHPSPFSAHRGFFGSNIFKKVEEILNSKIDWQN